MGTKSDGGKVQSARGEKEKEIKRKRRRQDSLRIGLVDVGNQCCDWLETYNLRSRRK
jgi:hypothetical protein